MAGIRRVSDLGTNGVANIVDGAVGTTDIAANAVTQTKLTTDVPLSGMRNRIINGGFDVWQRSTDATTVGADQYSGPDRWRTRTAGAGGSLRISRQLSGLAGTTYCARVQRTVSNNNTGALQIVQTFESVNSIPMAGQPLTFSFWARKGADYSPTSSLMAAAVVSGTGTDQYWLSFTSGAAVIDTTVTLTTSWQRFTFTATPAANASQFYIKFEMNPTGTAGTNDYFEVTGVQFESGSQATPFEQRPIGIELALCQRYCAKWGGQSTYGYDIAGMGWAASATGAGIMVRHPVPFRSMANSISFSGVRLTDFNTPYTITSMVINAYISNQISSQLDLGTSGMTAYRPCDLQVGNGSLSNYLILAAEL